MADLTQMSEPLVSIIIPTFNRADLIAETLSSIAAQTYKNWECVIVDDGSTDETEKVVSTFTQADRRFQFHRRPKDRTKGANACRNYGFELSRGELINWYDSDDVMLPNNIEFRANEIVTNNYDFIVTASRVYFGDGKQDEKGMSLSKGASEPNLKNFVLEKVFWVTDDIMYARRTLTGITWNENLKSGQEFNFICKYLEGRPKGTLNGEVVSLLRRHSNSIQGALVKGSEIYCVHKFDVFYRTSIELKIDNETKSNLMLRAVHHYLQVDPELRPISIGTLSVSILKNTRLYDAIGMCLMIASNALFSRYHFFYIHLWRRLN